MHPAVQLLVVNLSRKTLMQTVDAESVVVFCCTSSAASLKALTPAAAAVAGKDVKRTEQRCETPSFT